jgi:hypothetical protein
VLKWHRFSEEAFCILKSLLSRSSLLQYFRAAPQEISLWPQNTGTTRKKTRVKVHHAEECLQLLDILRGGIRVDAASCSAVGPNLPQKSCAQEFPTLEWQKHIVKN